MKLILKTESPVHIGSGEILSPYSDYIFDNGMVYYIDHKKLERHLFNLDDNDKIIDEFIELIKEQAGTNLSGKYKLKDFFEAHSLDKDEFCIKKISAKGQINDEQIQRTISSSGRPYIPGSSIKGAIRTALLYKHLINDGYRFTVKKSRGYIGEDVFDKYAKDKLKFLHISDSELLQVSCLQILKTRRFSLKKGKKSIPVVKETIPQGKEIKEVKIQCKAKQNSLGSKFSYLYEGNEEKILDIVNNFYIKQLEKEITELNKLRDERVSALIDFSKTMLKKARKIKNGEGAILRLGSGKTFFENTISSIFTEAELRKLRRANGLGTYNPFPSTRVVYGEGNKIEGVLGWVKIVKEESVESE